MDPGAIRGALYGVLKVGLKRMVRANDTATAFARDPMRLPEHVLVRHWIEHVLRIRLFRPLDARATQLLAEADPGVAAIWKRYARSEAVHDRYFLRDLEAIGLDRDAVNSAVPFASTLGLVRFVGGAMRTHGPLPVLLYSFWAEENSETGSAGVIERTRAVFGPQAVLGAAAHRALDANLGHTDVIATLLAATIGGPDDLLTAAELLEGITEFIEAYFAELDAWRGSPLLDAWGPSRAKRQVPAIP